MRRKQLRILQAVMLMGVLEPTGRFKRFRLEPEDTKRAARKLGPPPFLASLELQSHQ